tara:strand:- start:112 stop:258 length:147 start_codon:yes stop_codon:yes gene_type:complete
MTYLKWGLTSGHRDGAGFWVETFLNMKGLPWVAFLIFRKAEAVLAAMT